MFLLCSKMPSYDVALAFTRIEGIARAGKDDRIWTATPVWTPAAMARLISIKAEAIGVPIRWRIEQTLNGRPRERMGAYLGKALTPSCAGLTRASTTCCCRKAWMAGLKAVYGRLRGLCPAMTTLFSAYVVGSSTGHCK
jgi:hypothetical protein